jgi:rhodanese-related sulfurtransferase
LRRFLKRVRKRISRNEDRRSYEPLSTISPEPPESPTEAMEEPMNIEIEGDKLTELHEGDSDYTILDIREPYELNSGIIDGSIHIPMNSIPNRLDELPEKSSKLVIYCAHGVRSYSVTAWLREQGWEDSWSLAGGLPSAPTGLQRRE